MRELGLTADEAGVARRQVGDGAVWRGDRIGHQTVIAAGGRVAPSPVARSGDNGRMTDIMLVGGCADELVMAATILAGG